jgi:glycosyltransferase involved in cell wall biosynthesis
MSRTREDQRATLLAEAADPANKQVSAMMRVRDEAEFLGAAVESIIGLVDEVVLVDNLSRDATPTIIESLAQRYPDKVRSFSYPHEVLRVGRENWEYSRDPARQDSPRLSANYYNWCLSHCTRPYVLKWDGDMIALPSFQAAMEDWRNGSKPVISIYGLNLHPSRSCYMAARCTDREPLLARLSVPGLPWWATVLTRDSKEPRLFPRRFARYGNGLHWTQGLDSPCTDREFSGPQWHVTPDEGCFLHMKFCKKDPWFNYTEELARVIAANIIPGPPLDDAARAVVQRLGLSS